MTRSSLDGASGLADRPGGAGVRRSPPCRPWPARPRRALHLHARRRAALRDAPDADRGDDRGVRGEHLWSTRCCSATPATPGSRRPSRTAEPRQLRPVAVRRRDRPDLLRRRTTSAPSGPSGGHSRPRRPRPARPSTVYVPVTDAADGVAARHVRPSGRLLPERAGDRACWIVGTDRIGGREAILVSSATTRGPSRSPPTGRTFSIEVAFDRADGTILRLIEWIGGTVTREATVVSYAPDAPLPPSAFAFAFPTTRGCSTKSAPRPAPPRRRAASRRAGRARSNR